MSVIDRVDVVERLPEAGAPALQAYLAGVTLTSPDIQALAGFYSGALGYAGETDNGTWKGELDGRWLSIREGKRNSLDHAAFVLPDIHAIKGLCSRLRAAGVVFEEAGSHAVAVRDPDGNALRFEIGGPPVPDTNPALPARLQHLVFASDAAGSMLRFYCDVLGFAPSDYVMDDTGDLTAAFLRCSPEHHSLAIFRAPTKRLDHLCYDVEDWNHIRDWADRFAERHIALRWGPGRHGPGNNLFFFINDPDGNWLEFSSELDVVEGASPIKHWLHEQRTLNSWGAAFMRS